MISIYVYSTLTILTSISCILTLVQFILILGSMYNGVSKKNIFISIALLSVFFLLFVFLFAFNCALIKTVIDEVHMLRKKGK